jgi:hypothetical protein
MKTYSERSIGGNGFTWHDEDLANTVAISVESGELDRAATQLAKAVNRISFILARMSPELYALVGEQIKEAAEEMNSLNGIIGAAYDAGLNGRAS